MSQTRLSSLAEASLNTATGYILAVLTSVVVFPLFGVNLSLGFNMAITGMFTAVSIVRSYFWRRFFNNRTIKKVSQ